MFGEILARLDRQQAENQELRGMVAALSAGLDAVARGDYQLRQQNAELMRFQQLGYFEFALRVDGSQFRYFAIIMALGTRNAAATFLDIPVRSFYDCVEQWRSMAPDYRRMYALVEWRKRSGRHIKVRLPGTAESGEPGDGGENRGVLMEVAQQMADGVVDSRSYPAILRQILAALEEQNPRNWEKVRKELVELIKEELPQK